MCVCRAYFPKSSRNGPVFFGFNRRRGMKPLSHPTPLSTSSCIQGVVSRLWYSLSFLSSFSAIVRSGPLVRKNGHKRNGGAKSGTNIFDCAYPWMRVHACRVVCWILKASLKPLLARETRRRSLVRKPRRVHKRAQPAIEGKEKKRPAYSTCKRKKGVCSN